MRLMVSHPPTCFSNLTWSLTQIRQGACLGSITGGRGPATTMLLKMEAASVFLPRTTSTSLRWSATSPMHAGTCPRPGRRHHRLRCPPASCTPAPDQSSSRSTVRIPAGWRTSISRRIGVALGRFCGFSPAYDEMGDAFMPVTLDGLPRGAAWRAYADACAAGRPVETRDELWLEAHYSDLAAVRGRVGSAVLRRGPGRDEPTWRLLAEHMEIVFGTRLMVRSHCPERLPTRPWSRTRWPQE